jgi:hypothetical protein
MSDQIAQITARVEKEDLINQALQKIHNALEHEGDTAGYSFLDDEEGRQILTDLVVAATFASEAARQKAERERDLLKKKAHKWNAEADRYLAQRDELTVALEACEAERDALRAQIGEGT